MPLRSRCHPVLGCGVPREVAGTPLWYCHLNLSVVHSGHIPLGQRFCYWMTPLSKGPASSCNPVPPAQDPWTPPWVPLTLASGCGGDNGADRHPHPRSFPTGALGQVRACPSPSPLCGGLGGLGHCLPWAVSPTAHGLSASRTLDFGTDNGLLALFKAPW